MLVGYARVSTIDQNLDLQLSALKELGCQKLYQDQITGTNANRPGLTSALEVLKENDTLVVWKLDRLGFPIKGLIDLVNQLYQNGIHFRSLTDNVDTSTPSGRLFFHIMASLAEMERELLAERTKASLASAKAKGRVGGRKRKMTQSKIESAKQLLSSGSLPKDVAQYLGISVPTLYRWVPASEQHTLSSRFTEE
jgi:DNA invertase Pin-like site-specific DNA recombinase